jgi:hypothetical protein
MTPLFYRRRDLLASAAALRASLPKSATPASIPDLQRFALPVVLYAANTRFSSATDCATAPSAAEMAPPMV